MGKRKVEESESETEFDFDDEENKGKSSQEEEEEDDDKDSHFGEDGGNGNGNDSSDEDDDFDSDSEEDVLLSSLRDKKKKTSQPKKKTKKSESKVDSDEDDFIEDDDDGDDSDSYTDDDKPLASLRSSTPTKKSTKKTVTTKSKEKTPKKKTKTHVKKTPAKKTPSKKKSKDSSSITSSTTSNSGPLLASAELYSKCEKGKLIQAFLCRWWYAITWPDPDSLPKKPPKHYDSLDGFPGVYVCTTGDQVGKLKDYRDKSTCPNFNNYAKKASEELKELLLTAIEKQKETLIEAEGEGTEIEKELTTLMKWAKKLNCKKADKDAEKVLKAARLSIAS